MKPLPAVRCTAKRDCRGRALKVWRIAVTGMDRCCFPVLLMCIASVSCFGEGGAGTTRPASEAREGKSAADRARGGGDHVFNTELEGRWGIWEAESRRLAPQDVIRMHREYGLGIFFYRQASRDELRRYKRLGIMNITVAHALYTPWKDHAFLKDTGAVRTWVRRAVAPAEVEGLAYDCESRIERRFALQVIQTMAAEVKRCGKLFITCPHFGINDPRFKLGPADYNKYSDIVMPWCYNLYGQASYKQGISELVRAWRAVIPDRTVYPIIDCEKYRSAPESAAVIPYITKGTDRGAPVNGCTLFYPYFSWSKIDRDGDVQRFYRTMRDHYGLKAEKRG